ncbi:MAG: hypothetical protein ACI4UJ_08955 [Candidatus Cryptobacteroides sp.]
MAGFDSSIYLDTRESITINTDNDYDTLARQVFDSVTGGKKVSEIGGGRILVDYSSWNRNRFIVCDVCEIPTEYRSNPEGAHEYRIDIKSGEGSSMTGDAIAALIFLAAFWLAGKYFTLNSIVLLIAAIFLAIACAILLFVLPKMQKFGVAEAVEVANEVRKGLNQEQCRP